MDRILYKELNGDITCRARDFDKVFPALYAYEDTGMTPEQIVAMKGLHTARQTLISENKRLKEELEGLKNSYQQLQEINDHTFRSNQAMWLDLKAMAAALKKVHGCDGCAHCTCGFDEEPCVSCLKGGNYRKWTWKGE